VTHATPIRQLVPVEDYLSPQTRFAHLFRGAGRPDVVAALQERADRNISGFQLRSDDVEMKDEAWT
jgi:pyruvate ferredoxin oxidoreductase beta subunit